MKNCYGLHPICHAIWLPSFWFHWLRFLLVWESKQFSGLSYQFLLIPELSYFSQEKEKHSGHLVMYIHFKCFNMFITFKVLVYKKIKNYARLYFNDTSKLWFHFNRVCVFTLPSYVQLLFYHKNNMRCQVRVPPFFSCSQLGVKEEPSHLLNHIFMTPYQPIQGPTCASAVCNTSGKTAWDYPLEIVFN